MEPTIEYTETVELLDLREKYLVYGQHLASRIDYVQRARKQLNEMELVYGRNYGGLMIPDRDRKLANLEGVLLEQLKYTVAALKALVPTHA